MGFPVLVLQPNPNRRKAGRPSTAEGKKRVQSVEQVEEVNHVQGLMKGNVSNKLRPNSRRRTMEPKELYKRMERLANISRNDFKDSYRRLISFVPSVSLVNFPGKNFYTQAVVRSRKSLLNTWNFRKVLVDSDSTLNLISQRTLETMKGIIYPEKSMIMIIANGDETRLPGYT